MISKIYNMIHKFFFVKKASQKRKKFQQEPEQMKDG